MRVLQVLPTVASDYGGPVRSTLANCRALHAVEPDVTTNLVATDQGLTCAWRDEMERRMPERMDLRVFPGVGRGAFIFSRALLRWVGRKILDFDLLVVRGLFNPISSGAAWLARRKQAPPYIVVPHGMLSSYTFAHRRTILKRVYFRLIERRTLAGAAAVRFTSEAEREEAPLQGDAKLTRVIPHPFESMFEHGLGEGGDEHRVLFVSRLHPKKGLDVLLPAAQILAAKIPGFRLVLAGSGEASYEDRIRRRVSELGLRDHVDLPGFVTGERKRDELRKASVFVLPSKQENFGVAAVEAMDAGLPVVLSRGVDIWEEVEKAEAGLVVDRDGNALSNALLTLIRDGELRHRMGQNGRQLVHKLYDPDRIGSMLTSLYRMAVRIVDEPEDIV